MSAAPQVPAAGGTEAPANRWRILVVLCLSLSVVMVANGSLNVALPAIARDLDPSTSSLQWIVDSYALVFAGLLFAAGTIGDRFGRKGALQGGLLLFLLAAAAGVVADTATQVIAVRAVMGVAAAFVMPSTLSILANVFPAHERARAISMWAGIAAGGAALGPPTSGYLLEHFWWGSVFLVNVPLVAIALVAGRIVPSSKDPEGHALDLPGVVLSILGVGAAVYAIIEAPNHGWLSAETATAAGLAALALVAFVLRERTAANPMLDLRLFRDPRFSVASLGIALAFFALFGMMFLLAQYVQLVLGYSAFESGLLILPLSITLMLVAPRAPRLVNRFGVARVVPTGLALVALGLAALGTVSAHSPVARLYLGLLPLAVGMAMTTSPLTSLIMAAVPPGRAGMGSATNDTTRELGGALGVAVLGSIVSTGFARALPDAVDALPEAARAEATTGLAGALQVAARLPGATGTELADAARSAFVDGFGMAMATGAAVIAGLAIATRVLLPHAVAEAAEARDAGVAADGDGGDGRDGDGVLAPAQ